MSAEDREGKELPGAPKESLFSGLPSYPDSREGQGPEKPPKGSLFPGMPSYEAVAQESLARVDVVHQELVCGECELPRAGLRSYTVLHLFFLCVFWGWRLDEVFKCPGCMRRYLLSRLPLAVLLANVFAPLVVLWWGFLFLRTFSR